MAVTIMFSRSRKVSNGRQHVFSHTREVRNGGYHMFSHRRKVRKGGYYMRANLRKGPTSRRGRIIVSIAHNFKAIITTGLKSGIAILQSLHYTRCKFRTLSTSGLV